MPPASRRAEAAAELPERAGDRGGGDEPSAAVSGAEVGEPSRADVSAGGGEPGLRPHTVAMDVARPCIFLGLGAMDTAKPC